jgi:hypothetical protein
VVDIGGDAPPPPLLSTTFNKIDIEIKNIYFLVNIFCIFSKIIDNINRPDNNIANMI